MAEEPVAWMTVGHGSKGQQSDCCGGKRTECCHLPSILKTKAAEARQSNKP